MKWVENEERGDFIPIIGDSVSNKAEIARCVISSMSKMGMNQLNNVENASGNVLDLIYSNALERTTSEIAIRRLIPAERSDKAHNPLSITMECNPTIFPMIEHPVAAYCFRKANFAGMNEYLKNYDYDSIYSYTDVNDMLEEYYKLIYKTFELFVPKSTIKPSNNPTWFNKKLCNLKNIRNRQYRQLCEARNREANADSSAYDKVNEEFETLKLQEYNKFVHEVAMNSKKQPIKFWKFINGKRKSNALRKLAKFPIGNKTLRWFNSYSSNRKHRVKIGTEVSEEFSAPSAIGKGTILGPTLFLTFLTTQTTSSTMLKRLTSPMIKRKRCW